MKNKKITKIIPSKLTFFLFVICLFAGVLKLLAQGPAVTDIIYPKYMEGFSGSTNTNKVPFFYYAKLTGLTASSTYRYFNTAVQTMDLDIDNGAGNPILVSPSGSFTRVTTFDLSTAGNYGEFTTNAAGEYTGWFGLESNSNIKFTAGYDIHMKIVLNNGVGGNYEASRLRISNTVRVLDMFTTTGGNNGTAIRGNSSATAKNFIVLYDNLGATGRPIVSTVVENDDVSNTIANGYASFYETSVNGVAGAWGTIIPNGNANGIKRIEQRNRLDGSLVGCAIDQDGIWTTGSVNTNSPIGGTTPLVISATDAPLTSCQATLYTSATVTGSPFCPGEQTQVGFSTVGTFNVGNIFTAQLSDAAGSFSSPINIGSYTGVNSWVIDATIPNVPAGTGYRVRVVSSNPAITSSDNGNNLTITAAPNIITQPATQSICTGDDATLTIVATGINITYQWRKNGVDILGDTTSTFTITNSATSDAGQYSCYLTSSGCFTLSNTATLNVSPPPQITTQPQDQTVCFGQSVTLTVITNTSFNNYQWKKGGVDIPGATNYTYTINPVNTADEGTYSVVVTNGTCIATSVNATLTVVSSPIISAQPLGSTICVGSPVSMSVTASGTLLNYQWRKGFINIPGANTASYTIPTAAQGDAGDYNCIISSGNCSIISADATIVVKDSIIISTQPSNHTICAGQSVSFIVYPNDTAYDYQWTHDGTNIPNATSNILDISNATLFLAGNYMCNISNGHCTTNSTAGVLTVLDGPVITTEPISQGVCTGAAVTFSVVASGSGITYQWKKGGIDITGATSSTYSIPSAAISNNGSFTCYITNGICSTTSASATLNVSFLPSITTQPTNKTVCESGSASFLVIASGSSITYQWTHDTINISGATLNSYTINNANTSNGGVYRCTISSGSCSIKTNSVSLTVNPTPPTPTITSHLDTLISSASTGNQWYDINGQIPGATLQKLKVPNVGSFYVIVTSAQGCKSDSSDKFVYTSIDEQLVKSFLVYPNPCKQMLTIQTGMFLGKNIQIDITNLLGTFVEKRSFTNAKETIQVDLSNLTEGIYFIRLNSENKTVVKKVIIEK